MIISSLDRAPQLCTGQIALKQIVGSAGIALCLLGASHAPAQVYPAKPIRLIAPYPPGGGIDSAARIIGQALSEQLGQSVIIDNRAGATGRIGTEIAAKSSADGYTLLLGSSAPNAIIPAASSTVAYDAVRDFAPISLVGKTSYVLVVHPSLPVRTVRELIDLARANPGKLTFASSGVLGASHLAGELLSRLADIKIVHVAYKGTGPAAISVLTGETAMSFAGGAEAGTLIAAKRLRALGTTGPKRAGSGLPTISETLPGYDVTQWYGVLAPAGTPPDVLERLHREIVRALANPRVVQQFTNLDIVPTDSTPQEFSALIKSEMEKWSKVIKAAKIPVD